MHIACSSLYKAEKTNGTNVLNIIENFLIFTEIFFILGMAFWGTDNPCGAPTSYQVLTLTVAAVFALIGVVSGIQQFVSRLSTPETDTPRDLYDHVIAGAALPSVSGT